MKKTNRKKIEAYPEGNFKNAQEEFYRSYNSSEKYVDELNNVRTKAVPYEDPQIQPEMYPGTNQTPLYFAEKKMDKIEAANEAERMVTNIPPTEFEQDNL